VVPKPSCRFPTSMVMRDVVCVYFVQMQPRSYRGPVEKGAAVIYSPQLQSVTISKFSFPKPMRENGIKWLSIGD
jgi:hypothetical protein